MQTDDFRATVEQELTEFAWSQWAQLGVSADVTRRDRSAQDPEALLIFTLDIARGEPRLFDEVLDWLRLNGRLLMRQRLENLTRGDNLSRRLVRAAMSWASSHGASLRWQFPKNETPDAHEPEKLFIELGGVNDGAADPHFHRFGFERPLTHPSLKSRLPNLREPINFAFRVRELLGLGSRAEIVRYLITTVPNEASASEIAEAVSYAKRNVAESLRSLVAGGLVYGRRAGNELLYRFDETLLSFEPSERPTVYVAWPQLLRALAIMARWLREDVRIDRTDYMRASDARRLVEGVRSDLEVAGVAVPTDGPHGTEYLPAFEEVVNKALDKLHPLEIESGPELVNVRGLDAIVWRWRLKNRAGETISVLVEVSNTAMSSTDLPRETAQAIRTKGLSAIHSYTDRGEDPPERIVFTTRGEAKAQT